MANTKRSNKRKKFDYDKNRKNLKSRAIKKAKPRIEMQDIRNAWDQRKSTSTNLREMGLSFDPNRSLPIKKDSFFGPRKETKAPVNIVTKPYVVNRLEQQASLPGKDTKTLSSDLIEYVQHMIREHKDNYKAMARDEKNYYQDTPKQIKRKINEYKRCHSAHYDSFISSLVSPEPTIQ
ncbi:nucleolar protein 16 [Nerophis ophidion]|uniref:nucleolar protein 16 n=1 Tax=Nerophis ophidion TaxID=159077 RepID=UPI002ADF9384|nr:nucleolar protein 16 [Nerophis ophidion]